MHFRLLGPVVADLQEAFAIDWAFSTGERLTDERWFPVLAEAGDVWARGITNGPDEDLGKMQDALLAALSVARREICIVTPYFLPTEELSRGLGVAALRGVRVRILVPAKNNIPIVQWASNAMAWQVLSKGCLLYETSEPFDHSKLFIVDGIWSLIGSANWDPRSLRLNFEYNVECYDAELGARLLALVEEKMQAAREITLSDVNNRPLPIRLRDGLARLLTPYL